MNPKSSELAAGNPPAPPPHPTREQKNAAGVETFVVPSGGYGPVYHGTPKVDQRSAPGGGLRRSHFLEGAAVHAGTAAAAIDRRSTVDRTQFYEMTVRTGSTVAPLVSDAMANQAEGRSTYVSRVGQWEDLGFTPKELRDFDVVPYVNESEDPGSISYMVKPSALRNVRPLSEDAVEERAWSVRIHSAQPEQTPYEMHGGGIVRQPQRPKHRWLEDFGYGSSPYADTRELKHYFPDSPEEIE